MTEKFYCIYLIFVQLAVFVLLFALVLKRDDNETYEYVDHEECNNDYVNNVVGRDDGPKVVNWSVILLVGID